MGSSSFTVTVTDNSQATTGDASVYFLVVDPAVSHSLSVAGLPATLNPTQPFALALTLAAPHPSDLTGTLTMTFTSKAEIPSDDPYTEFSTGSRTLNFTIPANSTTAALSRRPPMSCCSQELWLELITAFTASIQNGPSSMPVASVDILATPPQITSAEAIRTAAGLQVQITGYASARRVTSAEFTFELSSGTENPLTQDVSAAFNAWFTSAASTVYGGQFSYVQSFTVTAGDASLIQAVTVRLTNAQGSTTSARLPLQ